MIKIIVLQRQLTRSLQMKKIIANAPLCVLLCSATAYKDKLCTATDQHMANIEIIVYLLRCMQCSLENNRITNILHIIYTKKLQ